MTEKNDQKTDSMTEEEEESLLDSEEQENQLDAKHRTPALASLIAGYTMALGFGVLLAIVLSSGTTSEEDGELVTDDEVVEEGEIVSGLDVLPQESDVISLSGGSSIAWPIGKEWVDPGYTAKIEDQDFTPFVETVSFVDHTQPGTYKVVYTVRDPNSEEVHSSERFVTVNAGGFIHNANPVAYNDRLDGVIVDDDPIRAVVGDSDRDVLYLDNDDRHLRHAGLDIGDGRVEGGVGGGGNGGRGGHGGRGGRVRYDDDEVVSLDARLRDLDEDLVVIEEGDDDLVARLDRKDIGLERGGNDRVDIGNFVPDDRRGNDDDELGNVGDFGKDGDGFGKGTLPGVGKGSEVYAYNFPSQGVGRGSSPALGAAAGFAGLGAGIGQAVMDGQAVPALGGIGTYTPSAPAKPAGPDSDNDGVPDAMEPSFKTNRSRMIPTRTVSRTQTKSKECQTLLILAASRELLLPGTMLIPMECRHPLKRLYGLNPSSSDSDGDGFTDGEELAAMTNPKSPESNPGEMGGPALAVAPGVAGGVAGLVSGAGAGSAAGLVSGRVSHPLGLGVGEPGPGIAGYGRGGIDGIGGRDDRDWDFDHLPKDGNLYIMMHVDGSGSILDAQKVWKR